MADQLMIPPFRAAWTHNLFNADTNGNHGITMLLDKTPENDAKLAPIIQAVKAKCDGVHGPSAWKDPATKKPIQDGDTARNQQGQLLKDNYAFYENRYIIRANSQYEIGVVKPGGKKPDGSIEWVPATQQDVYPGCICQASVTLSAGNYQGKYVKFYLQGVAKIGDDTPFEGGRQPVDTMFASVQADTSEFDMPEEKEVSQGLGALLA